MSNIDIKFYLVCQYFGIKSFIMGSVFFHSVAASVISVIAVLPILRLTAGSITNGPIPMASSESFMALSMVAKQHRRPRLYLRHLLLLFRGYAPLLSSNTYAWHLLNSQIQKNFVPSKLDTAKSSSKTPQHKSTCPFTS
jgi:hypothetical protein